MRNRFPRCAKVPSARGAEDEVACARTAGEQRDLNKCVGVVACRGRVVRGDCIKRVEFTESEWIAGERSIRVAAAMDRNSGDATRAAPNFAFECRQRQQQKIGCFARGEEISEPIPFRRERRPPGAVAPLVVSVIVGTIAFGGLLFLSMNAN